MLIDNYCDIIDGGIVLRKSLSSFQKHNILTDNPQMKNQLDMLVRLGETNTPLAIVGEKGCGKGYVAQFAHMMSHRQSDSFQRMNCAYLTEDAIPVELFGAGRGAPPGLLDRLSEGSLYIENADLLSKQIQQQIINHISTNSSRPQNVRYMISLGNASSLEGATGFIEQFMYYFGAITFMIPPLRERPEDILLISLQQLHSIQLEHRIKRVLSPQVMEAMLAYNWPGNIRQLTNVIDHMAFYCDKTLIQSTELFEKFISTHKHLRISQSNPIHSSHSKSLKEIVQDYEIMIINQYVDRYGSLRKAAAALNTRHSVLSEKLAKYAAHHSEKK